MNKFLLRVSGYLLLALAAYVALFVSIVVLNRTALANCRLDSGVDSVIVGDSHTAWAIDAAGIQGVQNVSHNAEGYKYTYAKLQHLFDTEPDVRRVYLGFSYHNLSSYYDDYIVGPTFRFFADRYLSVLTAKDYVELFKGSGRHAPDLFVNVVRNGLGSGLKRTCNLYGRFSDQPMTEEFSLSGVEKRIDTQYFDQGKLRGESRLNIEYLEKILDLARAKGVELVMLNTPLHPEYEKRVPAGFREAYDRFVRERGLMVFDFRDVALSDADFLPDGDHTNYNGARLATRRFTEYHQARLPMARSDR